MKPTLYHYVHCPYCVRVRLALGYLKIPYDSVVLNYDDEKTPVELAGKKMLPIFKFTDGSIKNESLDIIETLDTENKLQLKNQNKAELDQLFKAASKFIHSLAMPYWVYTPEFNDSSKKYFQSKKEKSRGPFSKLYQKRDQFTQELTPYLNDLETHIRPFYQSNVMTIDDICIASFLWGLYIVPEFNFSPEIHDYLQRIKKECDFEYHRDFWDSVDDFNQNH